MLFPMHIAPPYFYIKGSIPLIPTWLFPYSKDKRWCCNSNAIVARRPGEENRSNRFCDVAHWELQRVSRKFFNFSSEIFFYNFARNSFSRINATSDFIESIYPVFGILRYYRPLCKISNTIENDNRSFRWKI